MEGRALASRARQSTCDFHRARLLGRAAHALRGSGRCGWRACAFIARASRTASSVGERAASSGRLLQNAVLLKVTFEGYDGATVSLSRTRLDRRGALRRRLQARANMYGAARMQRRDVRALRPARRQSVQRRSRRVRGSSVAIPAVPDFGWSSVLMPTRPDLRDIATNVREALPTSTRTTLLDILTFVVKEYVVEGPPPMLVHQAETLGDLKNTTFAQLISALQTRLIFPKLAMFVVDGEQVGVRVGALVQPLIGQRQPLAPAAPPAQFVDTRPPQPSVRVVETTSRNARSRRRRHRRREACRCAAGHRKASRPRQRSQRQRQRRGRATARPRSETGQARGQRRRRVGAVLVAGARLVSSVARRYYDRGKQALDTGDLERRAGIAASRARARAGVRQRARRVRSRARESRRCARARERVAPGHLARELADLGGGDVRDARRRLRARRRLLGRRRSIRSCGTDARLRGACGVGDGARARAARPVSRDGDRAARRRGSHEVITRRQPARPTSPAQRDLARGTDGGANALDDRLA